MKHWKRVALALGMLGMLLAGGVLVASPALADDSGEFPSCKYYWTGIGAPYGGGAYTGSGDWYAYGPQLTSPSASACEDIQIVALYTMSPNMRFRIRFYPSGGGSYVNSWKPVNNSCWSCALILATNVANGSIWRVEGHELVGSTQTVLAENFDVNA